MKIQSKYQKALNTFSRQVSGYIWFSWYSSYKSGFRLDYAFISPELEKQVKDIRIYHDAEKRENKRSDHSLIVMEYSID